MRACAPGKVVLSGAYAVLEGAPALVAAVDRWATADSERPATMVTPEVAAAIRLGTLAQASWFDANALRHAPGEPGTRAGGKLGLGSSAAILVASLGVAMLIKEVVDAELGAAVFPPALAAHRAAQPGGSGIDVAASCFGGVLRCQLAMPGAQLTAQPHALPVGLVLQVWCCATEASTQTLLGRVGALRASDRRRYDELLAPAAAAAHEVAQARSAEGWIAGVARQFSSLATLGQAARVAIVTPELGELGALAQTHGGAFGPAGAGGGDVALWAGTSPPPAHFEARAVELGLCPLALHLGAAGVHRLPADPRPVLDRTQAPT